MYVNGTDLPIELIEAHAAGELVIFVGAGASIPPPSELPSFKDLVKEIRDTSNLQTRFTDDDLDNQPLDEILGKINDDHGVDVHRRIHELTSKNGSQPSPLHEAIGRLALASTIRIVTTNYDHHLSTQLGDEATGYLAPALPMGDDLTGIVYIHGRLDQDSQRLVCTDDDFGKAYLTDAWAARFLDRMFATHPVLFVGYSHNDTIMKYLARGLGGRSQNRYALTADADSPLWRQLRITPIECSYDDQPIVLNDWAERAAEGLLGHRARVKALVAEQDPSPIPDAVSYLETVLGDKNTVRFFTEFARGQSWLQWISGRPEFATLFWPAPTVDPDVTHALAKWFADNYVNDDDVSDIAFQLVAESGPHLVDDFVFAICRQLSLHKVPLSQRMRRWLLLVTGESENRSQVTLLASVLDDASLANDREVALFLFDYLAVPRVAASGRHFGATFEATTRENHSMLRLRWDTVYRPFLGQYAGQLLAIIDRHLRRVDLQLTLAGESDRERPSLWRPAISIAEDHQLGTPLGFLIDAARECLESLLAVRSPEANRYLEAWAESDIVLLRRLAIHGWTNRTDKTSSEKLQWFLSTGWLHFFDLRSEASRLITATVGSADLQSVTALIDELLAHSGTDKYGPWRAAALLTSIKEADPNLAGIDEALATLATSHPEIAQQDGGSSSQEPSAWDMPPPMDIEQLHQQLGEAPTATGDSLIACEAEATGWDNQRRWEQLAGAISALTQQYPEDGFALLDSIGSGHEEISNAIVRGWARTTDDESIVPQILARISHLELESILRQVTAMLGGFGSQNQPRGWHRFDESVELAQMCWEATDPQAPSAFSDGNDFLSNAINHPAGQLATYWVDRVGHLWRDAADSWNGIPSDLAGYLAELSAHDDSRSEAVRAVFSAYLAFFHAADREWCKQFLMPMLDWSDPTVARMAWTGYLSHGRGSDELLADGFLDLLIEALGHRHELIPRASRNLPLLLAKIAVESGVDPGSWINNFVAAGSTTDLVEWAQDVGHELIALEPAVCDAQWDRWIQRYLTNRVGNIPKALAPEEVSAIAVWVLYLSDSMSTAIDLLLQVPSAGLDMHNRFLHELRDERIEREPEGLARLVASLLGATTGQFYGGREVQRIYRRFKDCGISPDALRKIAEAALALGFSVE
ncbi:DUF4020 domain-containing protein [Mycobacterium frederiksbergense]|uniref:DUF4020 domain-containing protein n=1 Tax=Mycolicibacterium frederiksbergense TaxID=117567 RepID=UPI0021F2F289|nr:DUF4020 domain-containing protein [Mycolicibacterium frederiksbergense]MCV7048380.1 DUF4020 domain-containing protein [Mycolicibacterium frederiksbergense]